uniref:Uncharacterized protein n=1 Tax=Acidobacterium capsulatum TaxID=33075 RepID=A0A7V4XTX3_9BACT
MATLVVATLFALSILIYSIADAIGLQNHSLPQAEPTLFAPQWYTIFFSNLLAACLFYLAGRIRVGALFYGILAINLSVWSLAMSLIIPWMEKSTNWRLGLWMFSYIWLEVFAYMLIYFSGYFRRLTTLAAPLILAVAAYIEATGIKWIR